MQAHELRVPQLSIRNETEKTCHLHLSNDALDDRFFPHFGGLLRGHACILDAMNFTENRITAEGVTHLLREVHDSRCDRL